MQKILVLYTDDGAEKRQTMQDHIYCFERYAVDAQCNYCNVLFGVPNYLRYTKFDLIVLHYSLLGMRQSDDFWPYLLEELKKLREIRGLKIALPQDEYVHSDRMCELFRLAGVKTVYSLAPEHVARQLYPPEKAGELEYRFTFAGFADKWPVLPGRSWNDRPIEIGYRARKLPFWLGQHSQIKWEVADIFLEFCKTHQLRADISTLPEDTLGGSDWFDLLTSCKFALGTAGGASIHDPDGSIRRVVDSYCAQHPTASFNEVEQQCFPGLDGNLDYAAMGPRHFEYAAAGCCQLLVRHHYSGVLEPDVHYIPVEPDYSNLDAVWKKMQDEDYCMSLISNCRRDLLDSGRYSYANFVKEVQSTAPREQQHNWLSSYYVTRRLRFRSTCNTCMQWLYATWAPVRQRFPTRMTTAAKCRMWVRAAAHYAKRLIQTSLSSPGKA